MSPRRTRLPVGRSRLAAVEITEHHCHADAEGVIEQVLYLGERVEVTLLLSDGRDATALLHPHDWDWLELCTGDIVPVRAALNA
jgi:hypothetical protein